ncbi:MAG: HAD-IIIA family hydrolase [Paludibacteraceae bacterium]|nr:HAD-IIIA family hydrolase [Paludibacteraceae bacterium]
MINYKEILPHIKAFVFDVDGVLSRTTVGMDESGKPLRTTSVKDGYALQLAVKHGYRIAIITGANTETIRMRYQYLGIEDIYLSSTYKIKDYEDFKLRHGLQDGEILYMGDDIPDLPVLKKVGLPVCPADAAQEVKEAVSYISPISGGNGCVREIIEQTMKAQDAWMNEQTAFGW